MALLQKSIDKRNALLNATLFLVNNGGIQGASMAKVAKVASVSPATIYLYFESKQDLVNQLYLDVKKSFSEAAFKGYDANKTVKECFEIIWFNVAAYNLEQKEKASFLSQCDNTPMVDEKTVKEALLYLAPLFELWAKGKKEAVLKDLSSYFLYAFTIYPIAFLMNMEKRNLCNIEQLGLNDAFEAAWDSIKV